jgi:hypothetical protein
VLESRFQRSDEFLFQNTIGSQKPYGAGLAREFIGRLTITLVSRNRGSNITIVRILSPSRHGHFPSSELHGLEEYFRVC